MPAKSANPAAGNSFGGQHLPDPAQVPEQPEQKVDVPMAPPKPAPPRSQNQEPAFLHDISCVFLHDRASWPEFKKTLKECAFSWALPDWMTTIVYKETEWKECLDKGTDLSAYFPVYQTTAAGDGNTSKQSALGEKLAGLLNRPKQFGSFKPSQQFCC